MPPSNNAKRRSRSRQSKPLGEQLSALKRRLDQTLKEQRRQQQLRRQRQLRQRKNPVSEQQVRALRKAFEFRWVQRLLQKRQRSQPDKVGNPLTWLWPRFGEGVSTREAAARVTRSGALAMLLVILISFILNAIPIQVSSPSWYLGLLTFLADNLAVLIVSSAFALLSLLFSSDESSGAYRNQLQRLSRIGYIVALLLVPIQLSLTVWLFGQTYSTIRTQRNAIRANADALISGANQAANMDQFIAYLRSRNITANLQSIASAPLVQVRSEFIRSVKTNQQQAEQKLDQDTRSTLLRFATTSSKLFAALVILAGFMRVFQSLVRRCSAQWSGIAKVLDQAITQDQLPPGSTGQGT